MGDLQAAVSRSLSRETRELFDQRVAEQAAALRESITDGAFDSSGFAVGLEVELYAVDTDDRLTEVPPALFAAEGRTKEIGRHNIELNSTPQPFSPSGIDAQAAALQTAVSELRNQAGEIRLIADGLWTTPPAGGSRSYLTTVETHAGITVADNMRPTPRYCAIDNALLAAADGTISLQVPGADHEFPTILVESLTQSIQPHLQIPDTAAFPTYFNAAIRTLGPVLALASNSPFLPPDLYNAVDEPHHLVSETPHELRIPIFEQSVNSGGYEKAGCPTDIAAPTDIVDRVVADWTCGPFLREWEDATDPYWEFRHKYGTYWRWVRSIIGGDACGEGGSLRIEYRPLPTQPTVEDILALHWLVGGLLCGIVATDHPLTELPWADARESFYNAVDSGLDAELHWMTAGGEVTTDHDVIYEEMFALAERGLCEQGLDDAAAADRIAPIRTRWEQEMTPSQWKKDRVREELADGNSLSSAIESMQRDYYELSYSEPSFAAW